MKQEVTLTEQEVNQALLDYAEKHGVRFEGMSAIVTVVAGRGERGVYATIALEPQTSNMPVVDLSQQAFQEVRSIQDDIDEGVPVEVELEDADIDPDTQVFG